MANTQVANHIDLGIMKALKPGSYLRLDNFPQAILKILSSQYPELQSPKQTSLPLCYM